MTQICKAAVFTAVGSPIEIRSVSVPDLKTGQALVRIRCCTICGSDLHTYSGSRISPMPSVLGHEILGTVEALQGEVVDVKGDCIRIGDRVTWAVVASCGACTRCNDQVPQKCDLRFKYGHEQFIDGQELNGGLADYCVLERGTAIVRIPTALPDTVACPANCATATVAAAIRQCGSLGGRRVLVLGAGMLGLTTCAFAAIAKAGSIVLCDPNPQRTSRGADFGATATVSEVATDDFDCVFEMSGNAEAVETAVHAATIGGRIVLVGSVSPSRPVSLDPERIVRRLLTISGVHNYRPDDLETAVNFLSEHQYSFPFSEMVERSWLLSEVNEAFQFAMQHRPIRVALVPDFE